MSQMEVARTSSLPDAVPNFEGCLLLFLLQRLHLQRCSTPWYYSLIAVFQEEMHSLIFQAVFRTNTVSCYPLSKAGTIKWGRQMS